MLAERVAAGDLPAVDERLPDEPLVLTLERSAAPDGMLDELAIGSYGGDVRLINLAPNFAPEMYFMTIETLLARPGWISMGHPLTGNIYESYEISPDGTTFTFQLRRRGWRYWRPPRCRRCSISRSWGTGCTVVRLPGGTCCLAAGRTGGSTWT